MTKKTLSSLSCLLLIGACLPSACTIVAGTDDDGFGGFGGLPTPSTGGRSSSTGGGATTGGAGGSTSSTGGSAGDATGGSAAEPLDCQEDGSSEGEYKAIPNGGACIECLEQNCEASWKLCNTLDPDSACRFGSTSFVEDNESVRGEFDCMLACFQANQDFVGDEDDLEACQVLCGSAECDASGAGPVATDLAACLIGTDEDLDGCQAECGVGE